MKSTTLTNNNVIDVNDDTSIRDLIDTGLISTWYGLGDNTACRESFGPADEFTEANYDQIDWCAGLLQGITDSIGSKVNEIRYSSMFDLNTVPDGSIDLADIGIIATYIGDNNQATCYTHYGFPAWTSVKPNEEVPMVSNGGSGSQSVGLAICDHNGDGSRDLADIGIFATCKDTFDANGDDKHDLVDASLYASMNQDTNFCKSTFVCDPAKKVSNTKVLGEKVSNCKIDSAVAGQTEWADGSLIRGCDNKVYRIENQVKRHIVSLKDLFKYVGQRINNVTDEIVALF
jgi:hypothetical protein